MSDTVRPFRLTAEVMDLIAGQVEAAKVASLAHPAGHLVFARAVFRDMLAVAWVTGGALKAFHVTTYN